MDPLPARASGYSSSHSTTTSRDADNPSFDPRIPAELIPVIIQYASYDDLPSCALVCKWWTPYSQRRRFSSLSLYQNSKCRVWNARFDAAPHLIPYIEKLWLGGSDEDEDGNTIDPSTREVPEDHLPFLQGGAALRIVHRLTAVRVLAIVDFQHQFGQEQQRAFRNMLTVEELELSFVSFRAPQEVVDFVSGMPVLQSLALDDRVGVWEDLSDATGEFERIPPPTELCRLRLLSTENLLERPDLLTWLHRFFDLTELVSFQITWQPLDGETPESDEIQLYTELVSKASGVKHLIFSHLRQPSPGEVDYALASFMEFGTFTSFQSLETFVIDGEDADSFTDAAINIHVPVTLLPSFRAPVLRRIELPLNVHLSRLIDLDRYRTGLEWERLDDLLASRHFPALQQVIFNLRLTLHSWDERQQAPDIADIEDLVIASLPRFVQSGQLFFR
ncbi:hypothetical protein BDZ89DRAFT_486316 [Hymenopellis radicata]|nr:hypothetical protein BDZ89DRAFT_486316 [Hymenopellis radicata]